jgi:hypothetical protein
MKPATAFAAGLWTGGTVVAAAALLYFLPRQKEHTPVATPVTPSKEIAQLRRDHMQLQAENDRLKQTIGELKRNVVTTEPPPRRLVRGQEAATPPPAESPWSWMVTALSNEDASAIPKLEAAAMQNDARALDALALLAEADDGQALTRVWASTTLDAANNLRATRLVAATVEVNPHGEELLQALFAAPSADGRLIAQAVEGLERPDFETLFSKNPAVPAPPRVAVDLELRLRLLAAAAAVSTDAAWQERIKTARANLQKNWSAPAPATQ